MTQDTYNKFCSLLDEVRHEIVDAKRPEYTEGRTDVLYNFKQTALELNIDPMIVAYIFLRKHIASISQVCRHTASHSEPFVNRIADAMNYLELMYALYHEHS